MLGETGCVLPSLSAWLEKNSKKSGRYIFLMFKAFNKAAYSVHDGRLEIECHL
ncbi:MAG: hypothetical protein KZQ76_08625 [Candidatus Thiodiazotropha sp. (ex Epidulcina cf. delphinae)]|nr:hypothetical protein [Candidatus Thiodiazotropha sp. (ex Epidulcina cf. delphinae)]